MNERRVKLLCWLGLAAVSVMCLSRIAGFGLADPDEGRYAEIPREMIELHDWLTPRLGYVDYFEKPPLLYWLVGLSFRLFGTSEWAARLTPACAAIAGVVLTHALGLRLVGRRGAILGAAMLITSPLYFVLSQVLIIDMLLTLCTTATLVAVYAAHRRPQKRRWAIVAGAAAGLGVLAKGPVALVLPGAIALAFLALRHDGRTLRALVGPVPVLVFAAIAAPWFVAVSVRHPDFPGFFFVRENLERAATSEVGHPQPPWYYAPVVLGGFFPWTLLVALLGITARGRAAARRMPPDARLFLGLWAGITVVAFAAVRSKLAPYVLPAFPPLALLCGAWFDRVLDDEPLARWSVARFAWSLAGIAAVTLVVALVMLGHSGFMEPLLNRDSGNPRAFVFAAVALGAVVLPVALFAARRRTIEVAGVLGVVLILVGAIACAEVAAIGGRAGIRTSRTVALAIERRRRPGDVVVAYDKLMQGLFFYTRSRPIQMSADGNYNEITYGAAQAPDRADFFWTGKRRLQEQWRSGRHVFIVALDDDVERLVASLDPVPRVLVRDGRKAVLVNFEVAGDGVRRDDQETTRAVGECAECVPHE